ncbi:TPA: hypothetical protein ACRR2I_004346 [Providencia rettgeri]
MRLIFLCLIPITALVSFSTFSGPLYLSTTSTSLNPAGNWDVNFRASGGYIGPLPSSWSNPSFCWSGGNGDSAATCGGEKPAYIDATGAVLAGSIRCDFVAQLMSIKNNRTGASLQSGTSYLSNNLKIGGNVVGSNLGTTLFGFVGARDSQIARQSVMCGYNTGKSVPYSATGASSYTRSIALSASEYSPGDSLTLCTQERFQSFYGQVYIQGNGGSNSLNMKNGTSQCTVLNTAAPTCQYEGEMNLDLGTVGKNSAVQGTINGQVRCAGSSVVSLSLIQPSPNGILPLKGSGGEVNSKISLSIDNQKYNTTTWTGVINNAKPVSIIGEISNSGSIPGDYSGQIVLFLNQQ